MKREGWNRWGRNLLPWECLIPGLWGIRLLLRTKWVCVIILGIWMCGMLPFHLRRYRTAVLQEGRFCQAILYLDTVLYAFLREGKLVRALETAQASAEGEMKASLTQALEYLRRSPEGEYDARKALAMIEQEWPCMRIQRVHRFLLHTEKYGGDPDRQIALLLKDRNLWEDRIRETIRQRKEMLTQILLSFAASLGLCGMVLYLPAMKGSIEESWVSNLAALLLLIADDSILLTAQGYLCRDWLQADRLSEDEFYERKLAEFRSYDPEKEQRLSNRLSLVPAVCGVVFLILGREGPAWICGGLILFFRHQHQIGRRLSGRKLTGFLHSAFPLWLMDLTLLLETENVHRALEKSAEEAPAVLKGEIRQLLMELNLQPESADPFHHFLREFSLPEAEAAMNILFSLQIGDTAQGAGQVEGLISENLTVQDAADRRRLADQAGGMYLLFLAPVFTASMKLVADMAVFLMTFLRSGIGN